MDKKFEEFIKVFNLHLKKFHDEQDLQNRI